MLYLGKTLYLEYFKLSLLDNSTYFLVFTLCAVLNLNYLRRNKTGASSASMFLLRMDLEEGGPAGSYAVPLCN